MRLAFGHIIPPSHTLLLEAIMPEDRFVMFLLTCGCGTELQVHGEYFVGGKPGAEREVSCPKCRKSHSIPTRPLRLFYRDEKSWIGVVESKPRQGAPADQDPFDLLDRVLMLPKSNARQGWDPRISWSFDTLEAAQTALASLKSARDKYRSVEILSNFDSGRVERAPSEKFAIYLCNKGS